MNGKNKAAILAIGTELTIGQITNRNASWISAELLKLGIQVSHHRTVPDERALILDELGDLESKVNILFVTGGLGPTTDDFTRDCISEWSQLKMAWDEKSWEHIRTRLEERKIPVRDFQKQQCFFPTGSQIIWNTLGTAHGFGLNLPQRGYARSGLQVFVLPGPPREVRAVWENGIGRWLSDNYRDLDRWMVKSWDCFGQGESEVAHRAETALAGCSFEKGYRVHLPYVEFKLAYPGSRADEAVGWISKVEEALGDLIVARDGSDPAAQLTDNLKKFDKVWIFDNVSGGYLLQRIAPFLSQEKLTNRLHFMHGPRGDSQGIHGLYIGAAELSGNSLVLEVNEQPHHWAEISYQRGTSMMNRKKTTVRAPYLAASLRERELQYFAESAILFWQNELADF